MRCGISADHLKNSWFDAVCLIEIHWMVFPLFCHASLQKGASHYVASNQKYLYGLLPLAWRWSVPWTVSHPLWACTDLTVRISLSDLWHRIRPWIPSDCFGKSWQYSGHRRKSHRLPHQSSWPSGRYHWWPCLQSWHQWMRCWADRRMSSFACFSTEVCSP